MTFNARFQHDPPNLERWHICATEGLLMTETGKSYIPLNQRGGTPLSKGREPYTHQTPPTVAPKGPAASSAASQSFTPPEWMLAAALAEAERDLAHLRGVIAAAVKHARKTRELNRTLLDNLNGFASGADFQARDTLVILSNA